MDYKKEQVRRIHKFVLSELETLKGAGVEEKLERGNVLYNVSKIVENYDALEDILIKYFSQKAQQEKWDNKDMEERS